MFNFSKINQNKKMENQTMFCKCWGTWCCQCGNIAEGGPGVVGKAEQYRRRKEPSKAQGSAGWGGTDRIFNAVLLVPHMGIGQSTAQGGFKVTLSSMRPGLFLAELCTPAALAGLFWPLKRCEEHQLAELGTLAGNPSTELEKIRWTRWGTGNNSGGNCP